MKTKHLYAPLTLALAGTLIALSALPAQAELRRYILEWSGEPHGNRAKARGFIVIDDDPAVFENPALNFFPVKDFVKDFQITVSKASDKTHNGTFKAADFDSGIYFESDGGGVDLTRELVGQAEFKGLYLQSSNPVPPKTSNSFTLLRTGGGTGDLLTFTSFRPVTATSARVYKCTMSLKGSYKYCDRSYFAQGEPQWVCKKYRQKANYFMTIDPVNGKVSFIWLDPKARSFEFSIGYALPDLKYAQCRPPTASAPAGRWEACLPLWCQTEDINIDFADNPNTIDATRCRIACLTGVESLRTFTFREMNPDIRVRLKDYAVANFKGGFCQTTCYDTVHYSFDDPKRDKALRWPFAPNPGAIMPGGGFSCVTGTISCRLDPRLTGEAIRVEREGILANPAENALIEDLEARGWTHDRGRNKGGAPLALQPGPDEHLQPLIP